MQLFDLNVSILFSGETLPLSGRVFLPESTPSSDILVYHPGTPRHALHCATEGRYDDVGGRLAALGCIVLIPDYVGCGAGCGQTPMRYLYKPHAGLASYHLLQALIQRLDAQRRLPEAPEVGIFGYSLGAHHAVGLLQRLERSPLRCRPRRFFAGGGIFDLEVQLATMFERGRYPAPAYIVELLASLLGRASALSCFSPACRDTIRRSFDAPLRDLPELNPLLAEELELLLSETLYPSPSEQLRTLLKAHTLDPLDTTLPEITLYHAQYDDICYVENFHAFVEKSPAPICTVTGKAASHLEGSEEYFGLLVALLARDRG